MTYILIKTTCVLKKFNILNKMKFSDMVFQNQKAAYDNNKPFVAFQQESPPQFNINKTSSTPFKLKIYPSLH